MNEDEKIISEMRKQRWLYEINLNKIKKRVDSSISIDTKELFYDFLEREYTLLNIVQKDIIRTTFQLE